MDFSDFLHRKDHDSTYKVWIRKEGVGKGLPMESITRWLVRYASDHTQHIQKAVMEMNDQLHKVIAAKRKV